MSKQPIGMSLKPKTTVEIKKLPIFENEDSCSSDEEKKIPTLSFSSSFKNQNTSKMEKALEDNPDIYEYDKIYDEISTGSEMKINEKKQIHKPQHAKAFIQSASKRNLRLELVKARKAQKEEKANNSEVFVTTLYKKRQEELFELEKEIKLEEANEKLMDVTKQSGSDAMFRYMIDNEIKNSDLLSKAPIAKEEEKKECLAVEQIINEKETVEIKTKEVDSLESVCESDDVVRDLLRCRKARERASLLIQKPDHKAILSKIAKKNTAETIQEAKDRYLARKQQRKLACSNDSD